MHLCLSSFCFLTENNRLFILEKNYSITCTQFNLFNSIIHIIHIFREDKKRIIESNFNCFERIKIALENHTTAKY